MSGEPRRLGRYICEEPLGSGRATDTYRARLDEVGSEETFVVKVLKADKSADPTLAAAFVDAGRLASNLADPRVARVIDVNAEGNDIYVVTEFVPGTDLGRVRERSGGRLDPDLVRHVGMEVAHALAAAQALLEPVLHLGLSPGNIILTDDGEVKVTDFALTASVMDRNDVASFTYSAPEMIAGAPATVRSDLFSLGAVLYEMLSGKAPFPATSVEELLRKTRAGAAPLTAVPAGIARAVMALLASQSDARPESPEAAIEVLSGQSDIRRKLQDAVRRGGPAPSRTLVGHQEEDILGQAARVRAEKHRTMMGQPPAPLLQPGPARRTKVGDVPGEPPRQAAMMAAVDDGSNISVDILGDPQPVGASSDGVVQVVFEPPGADPVTAPIDLIAPRPAGPAAGTVVEVDLDADKGGGTVPSFGDAFFEVPGGESGGGAAAPAASGRTVGGGGQEFAFQFSPDSGDVGLGAGPHMEIGQAVETDEFENETTSVSSVPDPSQFLTGNTGTMDTVSDPEDAMRIVAPRAGPAGRPSIIMKGGVARKSPGYVDEGDPLLSSMGRRRRVWAWLAGAALVLGGGGFALWTYVLSGPPEPTAAAPQVTRKKRIAGSDPAATSPGLSSTPGKAGSADDKAKPSPSIGAAAGEGRAPGGKGTAGESPAGPPGKGKEPSAMVDAVGGPPPKGTAGKEAGIGKEASGKEARPSKEAAAGKEASGAREAAGGGKAVGAAALAAGAQVPKEMKRAAGQLIVATEPPGATVWVDGVAKGATPIQVAAGSGPHRVFIIKDGFQMVRDMIDTTAGEVVRLKLDAGEKPARGDAGIKVRCSTPKQFPVFVDGKDTGRLCPTERIDLKPGEHEIGVFVPGDKQLYSAKMDFEESRSSTRVYFRY